MTNFDNLGYFDYLRVNNPISMNVSLTPDLERYVQNKVGTGRYRSSSEVVREALRLLEEKDQEREQQMAILKHEIQRGIDSGDSYPLDMKAVINKGKLRSKRPGRSTDES